MFTLKSSKKSRKFSNTNSFKIQDRGYTLQDALSRQSGVRRLPDLDVYVNLYELWVLSK
jgi:hypothetical protein